MKKIILATAVLFSGTAWSNTAVYTVPADDATIRRTVDQINNGSLRPIGDGCHPPRKVYAVELSNGGYRADRYGNLQPTGAKAHIKYSCGGR